MSEEQSRLSIRDSMIARGETPCRSCPHDFPYPATHMATPRRTTGESKTDWPLCRAHVDYAMIAGWFPIDEITSQNTSGPSHE